MWHFCRQVKTLKILIVGFFKALDLIKISFDLLSPGPPPYPILWPTLAQYGLTIVRVVIGQFGWHIDFTLSCRGEVLHFKTSIFIHIFPQYFLGGVVGVATRAVFKPTSYLTVCTILQVIFCRSFILFTILIYCSCIAKNSGIKN